MVLLRKYTSTGLYFKKSESFKKSRVTNNILYIYTHICIRMFKKLYNYKVIIYCIIIEG